MSKICLSIFANVFSFKLPAEEAKKWVWSEKMAERVLEFGYDGIELSVKRHINVDEVLSGKAGEVKSIAEKYGLKITALASHANHLHENLEKRKEINNRFIKTIEASSLLDVPVIVTLSGIPVPFTYFYPYPESNINELEKAWKEFKEVWLPLVDYAATHGVKIAIEAHYGQLVYNTQTVNRMFREIDSRALGLNLDPSHFAWQFIDSLVIVEKFGDKIYHFHAKDVEVDEFKLKENGILATGKWSSEERSWRFRVPGKGIINWKRLLEALVINKGYRGAISFEHEDPVAGLEEGAKEAYDFLRNILVNLGVY
jgi:sugar phosphate isomerase/epimerase